MRTNRGIALFMASLLLVSVASGCAEAPYRSGDPGSPRVQALPETDVRSLRDRVVKAHYATWRVAPGFQLPVATGGPHGKRIQIFLNDEAAEAREQALPEWPNGSIIVADVLDEHRIVRVAAMEKRDGAWRFAQWDYDGSPAPENDPGPCTSCHAKGTDGTLGVRIGP